ncbi:HlyD family secretion protein [Pseudooceanicola sp. CBS1P-1]|uniref:Biotin/lipoyl-binding protein n=2 Tax=Paracoccaceae TaxID=31989 RepID=A0A6L7FZG7_9RHOB|nr:HlyD family secretion protein [Pseudooceanicola endophyticus]MXN16646.1 biotin/lipoyl-binding protein [Pseudooceanicola albus]
MTKHLFHTLLAAAIGIVAVGFILFAWQLPPFNSPVTSTNNAYVHGKVTTIAPQLSGLVTDVPVSDFQQVSKGDVLARIDDRSYVQAVASAEASLRSAKASLANNAISIASAKASVTSKIAALDSAKAALDTAQTNWDREQRLKQRGFVAQSDLDDAQLTLNQDKAAVEQAKAAIAVAQQAQKTAEANDSTLQATVDSAQAALETAQINLSNTVIRAPEDGRLGQISVRVGQYVSAGTTLMSHVGAQTWVIANFNETQLAGMKIGQPVSFRVDAMGGKRFTGVIEQFSPATGSQFSVLPSSNATGNFTKIAQRVPVRITIDPDQGQAARLVPGLSVEVSVDRSLPGNPKAARKTAENDDGAALPTGVLDTDTESPT